MEGSRYSRGHDSRPEGGLLSGGLVGSAFGRPRGSNLAQAPVDAYGTGGGVSRTIDVGKGLLDTESPYAVNMDANGGGANAYSGNGGGRAIKSSMSMRALHPAVAQQEGMDEARARSVSQQRRVSSQASARRTIGVFSQHAQSQKNLKVDTLVRGENAYDLQDHRGSWKGLSLAEVSRLYSMKNLSLGDLRSHKSVRPYITTLKDGG